MKNFKIHINMNHNVLIIAFIILTIYNLVYNLIVNISSKGYILMNWGQHNADPFNALTVSQFL